VLICQPSPERLPVKTAPPLRTRFSQAMRALPIHGVGLALPVEETHALELE
jgi:hypothetical protein